jgi:Trypsin-like peptidase domain/Effector-associated domain 1
MGQLSGRQARQLSEALLDAFLPDAFDQLLYYGLEIRRANISMADSYSTRVFHVIRQAEAEGWTYDLICVARDVRTRNAALSDLAAQLGLSSAAELGLTSAQPRLERIINAAVPFVDVSTWLAQLSRLERQICRVEVAAGLQAAMGTGFLVASDLCLTNYHVVQPLIDGQAKPEQTRLRFDYRRASDGTVVSEGTRFQLADDWLVHASPPSPADTQADPASLPSPAELDFALLRVAGSPGETQPGRTQDLPEVPPRGWIEQTGTAGFEADSPLFLLQHPDGAPLKLAFGSALGLNANGTRLRHRVNSEPGSSGSPCFNAQLQLVGIHHAGDPNFDHGHKPAFNTAIPVAAILNSLAGTPLREELFSRS